MTGSDPRLLQIASDIAAENKFTVTQASYTHQKDFSFKWTVRGKDLQLFVSDYIKDAPDEVVAEFIRGCMTYICKKKNVFSKIFTDYMSSDEFILNKRPIFIKRTRGLTGSDIGNHRNIFDAVQRLYDQGLLTDSDIDNTVFSWSTGSNLTRLGYCSQLFRVVMISSVFDDPEVPEYLLDYVVYHECLHLRQGYRPFNHRPHDADFHHNERLFPNQREAEKELRNVLQRIRKSRCKKLS